MAMSLYVKGLPLGQASPAAFQVPISDVQSRLTADKTKGGSRARVFFRHNGLRAGCLGLAMVFDMRLGRCRSVVHRVFVVTAG
jgi:hypothetical protein